MAGAFSVGGSKHLDSLKTYSIFTPSFNSQLAILYSFIFLRVSEHDVLENKPNDLFLSLPYITC